MHTMLYTNYVLLQETLEVLSRVNVTIYLVSLDQVSYMQRCNDQINQRTTKKNRMNTRHFSSFPSSTAVVISNLNNCVYIVET